MTNITRAIATMGNGDNGSARAGTGVTVGASPRFPRYYWVLGTGEVPASERRKQLSVSYSTSSKDKLCSKPASIHDPGDT